MSEEQVQPKPTHQWVLNGRWIRKRDGEWLNSASIKRIYVNRANEICFDYLDGTYTWVEAFDTPEAAQAHLDKLALFYELKPVSNDN